MRAFASKQTPARETKPDGFANFGRQVSPQLTALSRLQRTCACGGGCPDCLDSHDKSFAIQKKSLEISSPADADEREADDIARKVVDGQPAEIRETSAAVNRSGAGPAAEASAEFHSTLESSKAGGRSLDNSTRSEMESKMGVDLSGVRIHTGGAAHKMNEDVSAKAFTHGQDIFFRQGEFDTGSRRGKELLAHELVHTRQQQNGLHRKIQRQKDEKKKDSGLEILLFDTDKLGEKFGKSFIDLISPEKLQVFKEKKFTPKILEGLENSDFKHGLFVSAGASASLKLGSEVTEIKEKNVRGQFLVTDRKLALTEHFYEASRSVFSTILAGGSAPATNTGMTFNQLKASYFNVDYKAPKKLEFELAKWEFSSNYVINKDNLVNQPQTVTGLLNGVSVGNSTAYDLINGGKASLTTTLKLTFTLKKSLISKLLKGKTEAEKKIGGHDKKEKQYLNEGDKAAKEKFGAENKQKALKDKIGEQQNKIDEIKDKDLSPGKAKNKTNYHKDRLRSYEQKLNDAEEAFNKEGKAMKDAYASANKEKQAAQYLEEELKTVNKQIKELEKESGSIKKQIRKYKAKVDRRIKKFERLSRRLSEKGAKWAKKQAVKLIGKKLTEKVVSLAVKAVAKVVLRFVPVVGQILALYDAARLIYDVGRVIWEHGLAGAVEIGWNLVKDTANEVGQWIEDTAGKVADWIEGFTEHPWNAVKDIAAKAWNWVKDAAGKVWEWVKDIAGDAWNAIKNVARGIMDLFTDDEKVKSKDDNGSIFNPPGTGDQQDTDDMEGENEEDNTSEIDGQKQGGPEKTGDLENIGGGKDSTTTGEGHGNSGTDALGPDSIPPVKEHGEKDLSGQNIIPPLADQHNKMPADPTATKTDKTISDSEFGEIKPFHEPSLNAKSISIQSWKATEGVKVDGKLYTFTLGLKYLNAKGQIKTMTAKKPWQFKRIYSTEAFIDLNNKEKITKSIITIGKHRYIAVESFILEADNGHIIYIK